MESGVVLYLLSTCPACKQVARLLDEHQVSHRSVAVDLLDEPARSEVMEELEAVARPVAFPILKAGDQVVAGNHPERVRRVLGLSAPARKGIVERLFRTRDR
jgi:glutaredoxin